MKLQFLLAAGTIIALAMITQSPSAEAQGCPPNSAPVFEADNVVHCRCIAGFENRNGICVRVTAQANPEKTQSETNQASAEAVISGVYGEAKKLGWSQAKLDRLNKALHDLSFIYDPSVTNPELDQIWKNIKASSQDKELARKASRGSDPGLPGAGTQSEKDHDCAVYALANAAQLPYGVVAARAAELLRTAQWRSAQERADPRKTMERIGLNGGEVIMLAEVFGRASVVSPSDFAKTLNDGKTTILVNVRHQAGTKIGHEVVLTKSFLHGGETWYEMMDSFQSPLQRSYLSQKDLNMIILEKGVTFSPNHGTVPELLR